MTREGKLLTELETAAEVRFQDCDPFGHLNNARYIDYFMNARQDQLAEHYGLKLFEHGRPLTEGWVVTRSYLAYLAPASMAEKIRIRTRLIHFSDNRLVVEGLMLDSKGRRIKSIGWIEFAYFSLATGRPVSHPAELMDLFQAVVVPHIYDENGFNRRVDALRSEARSWREAAAVPA